MPLSKGNGKGDTNIAATVKAWHPLYVQEVL
jgi:hypothetical protein